MAEIRFRMKASGGESLTSLARRFERAAAGGLQTRLVRGLKQEAPPALAATRAAWSGVNVESLRGGGSSSGLRARVAAATSATPTGRGVKFEVDGAAVDPAYGASLSKGLDGLGRWRHPTYGRAPWTQQYGDEVFFKTLRAHEGAFEGQLVRVVEQVAREIEG